MISSTERLGHQDRLTTRVGATFAVAALCGIGELAVVILGDPLIAVTVTGLVVAFACAGAVSALLLGPIALLTTRIVRIMGLQLEPCAAATGVAVFLWGGVLWHVALLPGDPWHSPRGLIGTLVALTLGAAIAFLLTKVSRRAVVISFGVVAALLTAADLTRLGVGPIDQPQPGPSRDGWFFLIVCDTLGARHMSAYGYDRETTPYVERLAEEAVVFDRALAASSWTRPSVASLLTSTPVRSHQMDAGTGLLRTGITSIGERFQEAGYLTAAFVSNPHLTSLFGFEQGFSHFDDFLALQGASGYGLNLGWLRWGPLEPFQARFRGFTEASRRRADELNRRFFEWFDRNGRAGGFVWLHYMDPHDPYFSPAGSPQFGTSLADRHDTSIHYWDAALEDLVGFLRRRGVWNDATVVLTSDHGEEFWEHGRRGHGTTLYDEVIHVPLILKAPRVQPRRIATTVSLLDVAPTLVELAGLEALPAGPRQSLNPFLVGDDPERGPVVSEILRAHDRVRIAVVDHPWKLILRPDSGEVELYDLDHDPGEQRPVKDLDTDITRRLLESVTTWPAYVPDLRPLSSEADRERPRADPNEALRALGYLDSN